MVSGKIRMAITVLIVLALFMGLVICTVDAKSGGTAGKGKGASLGKAGKSTSLSIGPTALGNAYAGRGVADSLGLSTSGVGFKSKGHKGTSLNVGPTALGNAYAGNGYADSFAVSTDGFGFKSRSRGFR